MIMMVSREGLIRALELVLAQDVGRCETRYCYMRCRPDSNHLTVTGTGIYSKVTFDVDILGGNGGGEIEWHIDAVEGLKRAKAASGELVRIRGVYVTAEIGDTKTETAKQTRRGKA